MVRSGVAAPHTNRIWCYACGTYALSWGWIRIESATVTDGDLPPAMN